MSRTATASRQAWEHRYRRIKWHMEEDAPMLLISSVLAVGLLGLAALFWLGNKPSAAYDIAAVSLAFGISRVLWGLLQRRRRAELKHMETVLLPELEAMEEALETGLRQGGDQW